MALSMSILPSSVRTYTAPAPRRSTQRSQQTESLSLWNLTKKNHGTVRQARERRVLARDSYRPVSVSASAAASGESSADAVAREVILDTIVPDTSFSLAKVSFGTPGLIVGTFLLSYGFGAYFQLLPGGSWSALMLTYGFPLTLLAFAFKYAELKPVSCTTYGNALALREAQATPILKQVREDVTRFRYGDEQHLEEALKRIFKYNQGGGIARKNAPTLTAIREEVVSGNVYSLVLIFSAPALTLSDFTSRQAKFTSFFGPGISSETLEVGPQTFEVRLMADRQG